MEKKPASIHSVVMNETPTNIAGTQSPLTKLQLLWARGPLWDHILIFVVLGGWLIVSWRSDCPLLLTEVAIDARRPFFEIIATVAGAMAGLIFASISVLINLVKLPMSALDRLTKPVEKRRVGDIFLAVLPRLLLTFVLAVVAIAVESDAVTGVWWMQLLVVWFALASTFGLCRVVWVLKRLLKLT